MAKKSQGFTVESLSKSARTALQSLKRPVMDVAAKLSAARERISDLAPKVVKLFTQLQADHDGFTFVDFARLFDASVPTHGADRDGERGYRNHPTYYTLQYMRRIVQTAGRQGQARGDQGVRGSATDGLARMIATLLQVVEQPEAVFDAFQKEFGFSERLMGRLRKRVENTKPLFEMRLAKKARVGNVLHMTPAETREASSGSAKPNAEPMTQPGRSVSLQTRKGSRRRAA